MSQQRLRRVRRSFAVALTGMLVLGALTPVALASGPPVGKIYDCYGFATTENYVSALQLKTRTTYLVAPMRKGNRLVGPAVKGTYTLKGPKLTFRSGTYAKTHWHGAWARKSTLGGNTDPAHIGLFTARQQEVLECYPH